MSSQDLIRDSVANGPKATTVPGPADPSPSERERAQHQRDALVALQEVIQTMILERNVIENDLFYQRAALENQVARLSKADKNIQNLQSVWDNMAAGFGLGAKK
ncbi:uncharacterized protein N7500_001558 [Penicillium coprophilum]|uniref:uncharacterized protein n=1 Tax=Penicillium coprophilum TaxID=36646 RepID=UPI0023927E90|nr:uncharacterized protein N7500_001558 [Penicillium coprophilum]KAJ5173627.1 hypothetical protein N7500_001558 [Penicillium coprophilum]